MNILQRTLKNAVLLRGIGVHSGADAQVYLKPAPQNHGIIFECTDAFGAKHRFAATLENLREHSYATTLGNSEAHVRTIEHLMAAIAALSLDNLLIEVIGGEVPIMDGSSALFYDALQKAGYISQAALRQYIRIIHPIRVDFPIGFVEFSPSNGCRFEVEIFFESRHIKRQSYNFDLTTDDFGKEIAPARTFGFKKDAELLFKNGLACGSSLENSIIIDTKDEILNNKALRFDNEFVRHKLLDAIGDTALLGLPFIGTFRSYCSGHKYNAAAVRAILETPSCYEIVKFSQEDVNLKAGA